MRRESGPRIVAFGGGRGLPTLLRGLRDRAGDLAAVVTVADDGGSSGRLRRELGVAPPGDARNCLVALAGRKRLAEVFDYRFEAPGDLEGHAVGNLIIAALSDTAGGFPEGVERAAHFLRAKGRVLPATTESLTLVVRYADGTVTRGESVVPKMGKRVAKVAVEPAGARAPLGVIRAIGEADLIVLSPGSLFTSVIPSFLGSGVPEALERFEGPVVYAANVMTQPGETDGFAVSDHLRALMDHAGRVVTDVLVNAETLPIESVDRYGSEGSVPVEVDAREIEQMRVRVHEAELLFADAAAGIRHDPDKLGRALVGIPSVSEPRSGG